MIDEQFGVDGATDKDSTRQMELLLESTGEGICQVDMRGFCTFANRASAEMLGYERPELIGRMMHQLVHSRRPDGSPYPVEECPITRAFQNGVACRVDRDVFWRRDGSSFPVEYSAHPILENGETTGTVLTFTDITERKRLERKVAVREQWLNSFFTGAPAGLLLLDNELRYVHINETLAQMNGPMVAEHLGRTVQEVVPQLAREMVPALQKVLFTGRPLLNIEVSGETPRDPGARRHWIASFFPLFGEEGRVQGVGGIVVEISDRKRAEEVLRESERRFRDMLGNVELIAMTLDKDGIVTFCNDYLLRLTGWKREEVIGSDWFSKFLPESAAYVKKLFFETIEAAAIPRHHENPIKTKEGQLREITWNNTMLRDTNGNIVGTASIGEDITERKWAEQALRESERKFRQLAETIEEVFWITNPEKTKILYISPGYEKIWGRSVESVYNSPQSWIEAIHPEDRERVTQSALTRQISGGFDESYRIIRPDGEERWIRDRAFPLRDETGVYRIVGIAEDITERKKLEAQFLRAQRMESIGTLAGGIAHDLNNVLAPILMATDVLRDKLTDKDSQDLIETVMNAAQRGAEMVRQVLTFSRGIEGKRVDIQFRHLVKEIANIIRQTVPKSIEVKTHVPEGLWTVQGDATQLHQVLMNLSVNARDAMPSGGKLTIEVSNLFVDANFARMNLDATPGPHIVLSVKDTGSGMSASVRERIFDPFFTTKGPDKGTGLGLSTVCGIVKSHGGFISVYSERGVGSEFKVFLPASGGQRQEAPQQQTCFKPHGKGELILVVDDEAAIRSTTKKALETAGYTTTLAENGAQAVALFSLRVDEIKLVLTDMAMPVMDGAAAIQALRTLAPKLKIVATSGFDARERSIENGGLNADYFLHKPFTAEDLLKTVRNVLDSN